MRSVPVKLFLGHLSLRGPVHDAVSTSVFHTLCASGMFFPSVDEGFHDGSPGRGCWTQKVWLSGLCLNRAAGPSGNGVSHGLAGYAKLT